MKCGHLIYFQEMVKGQLIFTFDSTKKARFGILPRYAKSDHLIRWFELPNCFIFHNGDSLVFWKLSGFSMTSHSRKYPSYAWNSLCSHYNYFILPPKEAYLMLDMHGSEEGKEPTWTSIRQIKWKQVWII